MRRTPSSSSLVKCALVLALFSAACSSVPKAQSSPSLVSTVDSSIGQQKPIHLGFRPMKERRIRVLLTGDSVLFTMETTILRALQSTGVAKVFPQAFPGWGLTTDPIWEEHVATMLNDDRPDIVLAQWIWDTDAAKYHPLAYASTLQRYVKQMTSGPHAAKGVIFLDWPKIGDLNAPMGPGGSLSERDVLGHQAWIKVARAVSAKFPGKALVADVSEVALDHGQFSMWLPPVNKPKAPYDQWQRARMNDGVHFCSAAAVRYSGR
ncbi:MAG: hypothetical protein WCO31_06730, partial [Actinomycetes bacterium]